MAEKKSANEKSTWGIKDIDQVAEALFALEEKNQKKWAKAPAVSRGEDMSKALVAKFGKLKKEEQIYLAFWVDICIYLPTVLNSYPGHIALMDKSQTLEKLITLEAAGELYIDEYLDWVSQFGCLLTQGSQSDIGAWFHERFHDLLSEIEAITWTDSIYDEELTSAQVSKAVTSKSTKTRVLAAISQSANSKDLTSFAKDKNPGVRYCVAANPKTPSKVLLDLSHESEVNIRVAVAANPSISAQTLETLATDKSPSVRKVVARQVETPLEILKKLTNDKEKIVRVAVAENPNSSSNELKSLASDKESEVRAAVAANPGSTKSILSSFSSDNDETVQNGLASNPNTPSEIVEKLANSNNYFIRGDIASRNQLSEKVCSKLAKDKEVWVRRHLAENPSIPKSVMDLLSKDKDSLVREALIANSSLPEEDESQIENSDSVKLALATNVSLPIELLAELSRNTGVAFLNGSFKSIRAVVAKHPKIDQEIVDKLYATKDKQILGALASNSATPRKTIDDLVKLSLDKKVKKKWLPSDTELEIGLASNSNTPSEYLAELTRHIDIWTVAQVASNPNMPIKILNSLSKHEHQEVRSAVAANPSSPWALLESLAKDEVPIRQMVASNPSTRSDVLEQLANDRSQSWVRSAVASNPSTPIEILTKLSKDSEPLVRLTVARNNNTSTEILRKLGNEDLEENAFILSAVIDNPNTEEALRHNLFTKLIKSDKGSEVVAACSNTEVELLKQLHEKYVNQDPKDDLGFKEGSARFAVLLALAKNRGTPQEILAKLASGRDTEIREAVAGNSAADSKILARLSR